MKCPYCDNSVPPNVAQCPSCGASITPQNNAVQTANEVQNAVPKEGKSKVTAGILALFLGGIGIHKFYLGYNGVGAIFLISVICTMGMAYAVTGIISCIEGIIYLTKSDEEFNRIYVQGKKSWF